MLNTHGKYGKEYEKILEIIRDNKHIRALNKQSFSDILLEELVTLVYKCQNPKTNEKCRLTDELFLLSQAIESIIPVLNKKKKMVTITLQMADDTYQSFVQVINQFNLEMTEVQSDVQARKWIITVKEYVFRENFMEFFLPNRLRRFW
ncbi:hypothetical protein [Priestia aryabhattai]